VAIQKPNFYLFTGGPGAGKSTVIELLAKQKRLIVPEVARNIIRHQKTIGGTATHDGDRVSYTALMLERSIVDFERLASVDAPVYFDRGLPDLYAYTMRYGGGVTETVRQAIVQYRYNSMVFLFPPWSEIYCHDTERKQSFQEAIETWATVKEGYADCGYLTIDVPKLSVEERVQFILKHTQRCTD
jgi:predicted ATPase